MSKVLQMRIEGTVDEKFQTAWGAAERAKAAKEFAKEKKDEAANIFKIKTLRSDYLNILAQIESSRRCKSLCTGG